MFDNKTGTNLIQWPVEEIEDLRLNSSDFSDVLVEAGTVVALDIGTATQVCLVNLATYILCNFCYLINQSVI